MFVSGSLLDCGIGIGIPDLMLFRIARDLSANRKRVSNKDFDGIICRLLFNSASSLLFLSVFCSKQLLPDGQIYGPKQRQKEGLASLNKIGYN
jgi:hypothetical protein